MPPVDDAYSSPFEFGGKIEEVVIELFGREVVDANTVLEELMRTR